MQQWCTQVSANVKGHRDHWEGFMLERMQSSRCVYGSAGEGSGNSTSMFLTGI